MIDKKTFQIVEYTPEPFIRKPWQLIKSMLLDVGKSRELAWRLFIRNISALYRQTLFGYIWAFLPPIFTTATFVFLNSQNILKVAETNIPYPVYVMIGTLLWQVFLDGLNSPLKLVIASRAMLAKINFPREALIIASVYEVVFNFLIRLVLLVAVFMWFNIAVPHTIVFVPLGVMALIMFGLMVGVFLTPLGMLYRDVEKGIMIITSMWFFLTPVVYPPPVDFPGNIIAKFNPVSLLLTTTREWLISGISVDLNSFVIVFGATILLLLFGWILYRISFPHIIARIGA